MISYLSFFLLYLYFHRLISYKLRSRTRPFTYKNLQCPPPPSHYITLHYITLHRVVTTIWYHRQLCYGRLCEFVLRRLTSGQHRTWRKESASIRKRRKFQEHSVDGLARQDSLHHRRITHRIAISDILTRDPSSLAG
jgi:hypothetical protein